MWVFTIFFVANIVVAPNRIQQSFPGHHPALVLQKELQNFKFPGGQGNASCSNKDGKAVRNHRDFLIADHGIGVQRRPVRPDAAPLRCASSQPAWKRAW